MFLAEVLGIKKIVIDAQTKTAYEDIDALEKRRIATKEVVIKARRDTSEWDNWIPGTKVATVKGLVRGGITWEG